MRYMTSNSKINVLSGIIVACVILECFGIYRLASKLLTGGSPSDIVFVVVGLVIGIPAALWRHYVRASYDPLLEQKRTEMNVLSSVGKKSQK